MTDTARRSQTQKHYEKLNSDDIGDAIGGYFHRCIRPAMQHYPGKPSRLPVVGSAVHGGWGGN
jgi:hypothetical protein